VTSEAATELKTLRRENAELRRANDILKTAFRSGGARPPTQVIVAYIHAYKARFGVEPICRVLSEHGMQIAPSTYYAAVKTPVSAPDLADAYLVNALVDVFRANRSVYGCRKLWHQLRRGGHNVGRDQVARLTGIAGVVGAVRGTTHRTVTPLRAARERHGTLI